MKLTTKLTMLASASCAALITATPAAFAQESQIDDIIVTGTRRGESTVQDAPINIAAVGGAQIEAQGLTDLVDVVKFVPGVFIVDQGSRSTSRIIVRGLNADSLGEQLGAGGTVATYLGDIPLNIDLKLNDVERVEFLLGPQGTLYGAGTLGGAIRYIPNRRTSRSGLWTSAATPTAIPKARTSRPTSVPPSTCRSATPWPSAPRWIS